MWASLNNIIGVAARTFCASWRKTRKGETLLEILIALFVLTTTSGAATFMIIQSNRTSTDIQRQFQARYLAREAFEHLKMVRDTNWIRFADNKNCWDIRFEEKDCPKVNPKELASNINTEYVYALLSGKPGDNYYHLDETSNNELAQCEAFTAGSTSPFAIYLNKTANPDDIYNGIMYSPDPVAPVDQKPQFCRKITLTKKYADAIEMKVHISWDRGGTGNIGSREYTSYLLNY